MTGTSMTGTSMISKRSLCRSFVTAVCLSFLLIATRGAAETPTAVEVSGQRPVSFNHGWRFFKGEAVGAENPAFDDSSWLALRLPHDWAIAGPFDPQQNPHTGALPISGTGWYRKTFILPESARNSYFSIEFDGAMSNAVVWLNGQRVGRPPVRV